MGVGAECELVAVVLHQAAGFGADLEVGEGSWDGERARSAVEKLRRRMRMSRRCVRSGSGQGGFPYLGAGLKW